MPPSKKEFINAIIFKRELTANPKIIQLQLEMRDSYRRKLRSIQINDITNPNLELVDINRGEKEF